MRAKKIFEFQKNNNPKASLGIGGINFYDHIKNETEDLEDEINMLKSSCLMNLGEYLRENLIGKTITAEVNELPKIDHLYAKTYKRIVGKHTFKVQDINFNALNDTHVVIADVDNNMYTMKLNQKIYIE
jgi:hypothetical protein